MKNKILYVILVIAACMGVQSFAAEVTNVEFSYVNGSTVANIHVDGTIRFTHQTEEAKDGKPFRVIVDVLSATHELGAKNFMRLPECSIEKLRTSQFSIRPEKIVRLVFDMKKETFYSINSDKRTISVTFPDKSYQPFTAWSSRSVVDAMKAEKMEAPKLATVSDTPKTPAPEKTPATKAKTAGVLNQSIEKDRQVSLASAPEKVVRRTSSPAEVKSAATTDVKRAKVPYDSRNTYGPYYDPELFASAAPTQVKLVAKADVTSKDAVSKAKLEVKKEPAVVSKPAASAPKTAPVKTEPKPSIKRSNPAVKPEVAKKPVMAKAESSPKTTPAHKPAPAQTVKQEKKPAAKKTVTTTVASKPKKESKSTTSRFRRSASSRKIKGTMVAEFPKRLVIKYKSRSTRDPFETLVNDTRVNNSVVERLVPNVEGLKLVGVIESADSDNRALFEDKSGYGYILKSGDKVRKGYVLRVESNRVYFQIFEYGWSRTIALNLEEN